MHFTDRQGNLKPMYIKAQLTNRCLLQSSGFSGHSRAIVLVVVPIRVEIAPYYVWGHDKLSIFLAQTVVLMHTVVKLQCILIML